ncbi:E3 SUMO-protein ligase RanBP2-like [Harmonia axyridis]|uniref:E3 SUMO-protein ligase RanBP2-like n=1 Tax=Harmonia axyridis TaxID=115357 RepID=UPI001E27965E|nr:E3 SUMO-protein ligase RanBP2-like [Harmonia axyridis]
MFSNKFEVDKHVESCLKKITNERERNNRSYTFAKLYYNVGDYEQTRRYVSSYLSVKPKSAEAHYLLGLSLEKLGKKDAALEAYRTSLQIDPKQNNLLLKVCELLANDDDLDVTSAKFFYELAENMDSNNPSFYNLKEKLMMSEEKNPESVIELLLKELETRPTDIPLRVRLLRNFIQNNKINEAYKHVHDIEEKNLPIFSNNLMWYEIVSDILLRYKRQAQPTNLNWSFWCLLISVLDRFLCLRLDERSDQIKENSENMGQLFVFDQSLQEASQNIHHCPDKQLANEFLNHYQGQLCLHFAIIIFKQAKNDLITYKEATSITLPLLFNSFHKKPIDLSESWIDHLQKSQKTFVKRWYLEAAFRCSQVGHTLLSAAVDRSSILISLGTKYSSGPWQEQIYKKVFIVQDQRIKMSTSYLASNHIDVKLKMPSKQELLKYDEESFYIFPDSLQHYIWVGLHHELADIKYLPFLGLQYSVKNLNNCGAETLNLLDVQAFLYASTLCAKWKQNSLKQILCYKLDKPEVLPVAVTDLMGSIEQAKFLTAAYKMFKNESGFDSGEMRLTLIRGIEAVRCVGRHGLDVGLLVQLGTIFAEKAEKANVQSEIEFNDARAEIYWKAALPILEKMKNNQAVSYGTNRMFDYKTKDIPLRQIHSMIERGKLYLGILAMKRKENEKALTIFEELKDPYASFHQAQIYKRMADHKINQNKESVTSEMRSQNIILLSKARDCFYLTLDRLREPSVDRNHPLNLQLGTEIEKIERLLSRIDPDANRNECDALSDENVSSADSTEHYTSAHYTSQFSNVYSSPYINKNETRNQSTPVRWNVSKKEAKPSPERLDAQLRQLIAAKDTTLSQVLEQNRMMVESQRNMVDELRNFKDVVYNLSGQVDNLKAMKTDTNELKEIKKSVDDLKRSVDDLQNIRNVSDMVYELKKELQNMKKDNAKPQHPVQDDLYTLDDDYSDYNLGNNLNFNANMYQNYPNRIPTAMPPPSALYPHGYYPPMFVPPYNYSNLGLAQSAAALAFGAEQQLPPDLRGLTNPMAAPPNPLYSGQPLTQPAIPASLNISSSSMTASLVNSQSTTQFKEPKVATAVPSSVAMPTTYTSTPTSKAPPVNVVITSSDPLPAMQSSVSQPVLSVTIPPQHIKGNIQKSQVHNYQIPLPATTVTSTPSVLCKPTPAITTEGMLSNVAPPVYSAISNAKTPSKNVPVQIENSSSALNLSKSNKDSTDKLDTNMQLVYECPGKLFAFKQESKQYTERGVGLMQILQNQMDRSLHLHMKKDNGNVIAKHQITHELIMTPNKDDSFLWNVLDFSSGKGIMEKFCLKLKNKNDVEEFYNIYRMCMLQNENSSRAQLAKSAQGKDKQITNKLGGFVFLNSPVFKPKENEAPLQVKEVVTDDKKQSPFANFSFGARNTNNTSTWGELGKNNQGILSNLSANPPNFGEPKTTPKVEGSKSESKLESNSRDNSLIEEFVPTAEFKPVIPLPEMVEVKTGEENAEVLFDSRAKLLRFDAENKEWKERGLGNMKVLKEEKLIRLLMRREQIHKVCCNHQLLKSMNFQYMPNQFKVLTWCAQDFAEEVLKAETFAIRFKTEEQATEFLKCILKAQESLNEDNSLGKKEDVKVKETTATLPSQGFGDKFKPAKDSWSCKVCYINNDSKTTKCIACDTVRPSVSTTEDVKVKDTTAALPSQGFGDKFKPAIGTWTCKVCYIINESKTTKCIACDTARPSVGSMEAKLTPIAQAKQTSMAQAKQTPIAQTKPAAGWGDAFKPKVGSWECGCCMVRNDAAVLYCLSCESPKDGTIPKKESSGGITGVNLDTPFKFSFGIGAGATTANAQPEAAKLESSSTFKFGEPPVKPTFGSSTFSFQPPKVAPSLQLTPAKDAASTTKNSFVFGSPEEHNFEFKPRSPRKSSGPGEESDGSYVEEECDNIYFKPVIPLPDKVEVKTGEEEEEVVYCHRAKLFRFVGGEWKERGIGDLKILKNKGSEKLRVLMRRDQVLKICLNHTLTSNIEYRLKDEKTWLFVAPDFSEGEVTYEQFCLRFKTAEIAKDFKDAVDKALGSSTETAPEKDDSSDIEFVCETTVTDDELKEAQKLQLPPKFFAFRKLPLCTCAQCLKDDKYFEGTAFQEGPSKSEEATSSTPIVFDPRSKPPPLFSKKPEESNSSSFPNLKDLLSRPPPPLHTIAQTQTASPTTSSTTTTAGCWYGGTMLKKPGFSLNPVNASDDDKNETGGRTLGSKNFVSPPSNETSGSTKENKATSFEKANADSTSTFGGPPVFGGIAAEKSGIFGNATSLSKTSIFGNAAESKNTSIFGSASENTKPSSFGSLAENKNTTIAENKNTSIFGNAAENKNTSIFGNAADNKNTFLGNSAENKSIFGYTAENTSVFGNAAENKNTSIFGNAADNKNTSIFGNAAENKNTILGNSAENKSIFGYTAENTSVFGNAAENKNTSIFGNAADNKNTSIFGNTAENKTSSAFTEGNTSSFGNAATNVFAKGRNLFGVAAEENKCSIFSSANTPKTAQNLSVFVTPSPDTDETKTEKKTDIFTTPTLAAEKKVSVFGDSSKPGTNLFGSARTASSAIFGTPKSASTTAVTPTALFGNSAGSVTTTSLSVFGNSTTTTASIFSGQNLATVTPKQEGRMGTFGAANTGSLFGSNSATSFGSGASFQFGKGQSAASGQQNEGTSAIKTLFGSGGDAKTTNLKEGDEVVLKCTSEVSFSTLAQQNEGMAFGKPKNDASDTQPFAHLGVGAPVFGTKKKQSTTPDRSRKDDTSEEVGAGDEEYDPHYEPIVPMPDAIVVTTGEEDETPLFNERAKLYRYDVDLKEWKERGVGQFKILHNPKNNTYRFLLRREQVHKVVLNQLMTTSLDLQPMMTSDKAWVWAGHNFVENEMHLEKLAVRFKYEDTSKKFKEAVQDCLRKMEQAAFNANVTLPSSVQEYCEAVSSDSEQNDVNDYDDNDYDVDFDERTVMFHHNCTLQEYTPSGQWTEVSSGSIEIYCDLDMYGWKICFIGEDGEILSTSVIGINTIMQVDGSLCTWRTVELVKDEVYWRDLRAIFPNEDAATKFHQNYLQGISYAQEWEIVDDIQSAEIEEID